MLLKESCNAYDVSVGWIDPEGKFINLRDIPVIYKHHETTAEYILKTQYADDEFLTNEHMEYPERALIRRNWIRVGNYFSYSGLHPSDVEDNIWRKQSQTIIDLVQSCLKQHKYDDVPSYEYYQLGRWIISIDDGADTVQRFFTWLLQKGQIAKSSISQFREHKETLNEWRKFLRIK